MKKKNNKILLPVILSILFIMSSCGAAKTADYNATSTDYMTEEGYGYESEYEQQEAKGNSDFAADEQASPTVSENKNNVSESARKLIRNAQLDIQTKDFDKLIAEISTYTGKIGGYIESSSESGHSYNYYGSRNANLTIRIPAEKFDNFISQISELAKVTSKNITVEDITSKYIDTESRIKALKAEQSALMNILEKATSVSDTLEIYEKLSDVNYRLENYESQLKNLDKQVSYSTITMCITEVERVTQTSDEGFFNEIKTKLIDNLYSIGSELKSFAIWFISSIPYIIIWAVVIILAVLVLKKVIRRIKRKRKKNNEE